MSDIKQNQTPEGNQLFPVFLKLEHLHVLIIGGGNIGFEKVTAIVNNSPHTKVKLVAKTIVPEIVALKKQFHKLTIIEKDYEVSDLDGVDIIIAATGDKHLAKQIRNDAHEKGLLVNVADTPDLCDFYLGSIVQKGDLKIAISTNGKSPTLAKRLKEVFNESLDEKDLQETINHLGKFRNHLKGDFANKVKELNELTSVLVDKKSKDKYNIKQRLYIVTLYSLSVISIMLLGHLFFTLLPLTTISNFFSTAASSIDSSILIYVLGGAIAQMIDGALGMAYGVSVTTFLMSLGIPAITPAVASASMHAAEIFTTGTSSLVYLKLKNVNNKLFRTLLVPGAIGAIIGAITISIFSKDYVAFVKPIVAVYTLTLGILIIRKALNMHIKTRKRIKRIKPVAFFGGLLDSIGGGGWGPIVTTSLIAGGRHFRYAIGSSHVAKFFVALISTITFISVIGLSHWHIIFGLVIGSMAVAPFSIYLSNKISNKWGLILVGMVVIIVSLRTFFMVFFK